MTTKNTRKASAPGAGAAKKTNDYQLKVLMPVKALKIESKKLGHAIGVLLQSSEAIKLDKLFIEQLHEIKKDSKLYKKVDAEIRRTKSGGTCAFYLLQYLYKINK